MRGIPAAEHGGLAVKAQPFLNMNSETIRRDGDYCEGCRRWQKMSGESDTAQGECRRLGPNCYANGPRGFPQLTARDWCEQFVPANLRAYEIKHHLPRTSFNPEELAQRQAEKEARSHESFRRHQRRAALPESGIP